MIRALYLECASGISGDMFVASLIDLGADVEVMKNVLDSLPITGFSYEISSVFKNGIKCTDFNVILDEVHDGHDHDMEYLHGDKEIHSHSHHHHHEHRSINDIYNILNKSTMSFNALSIAKGIFEVIAESESKAHGVPVENVHFHEVGAVDSIVDIVAAAVLFDSLNIKNVIIPSLTEGCGTIRCAHGILNIPVPAVVNIVSSSDLKLKITDINGELVTPTGAAIAATIKSRSSLPSEFSIINTGLGAGKRSYEIPSILRSMIIEYEEEIDAQDSIVKLESDIDDSTGEELAYCMELLYDAGAREVHYMPIYMKKNRPAYELVVICTDDKVKDMEAIIFSNTTTIGIRKTIMERSILKRYQEVVNTKYGLLEVKTCVLPDGSLRRYPEFESMKKLSKGNNVSIKDIKDCMVAFNQ